MSGAVMTTQLTLPVSANHALLVHGGVGGNNDIGGDFCIVTGRHTKGLLNKAAGANHCGEL